MFNIILTQEQKDEMGIEPSIKRNTNLKQWCIENIHAEGVLTWLFFLMALTAGLFFLLVTQ